MAIRSPSPNLSRPRTPESSHGLRKSKEIPQRSSLSKPSAPNSPSIRASFEQKENAKSRSPATSSSKGSKNFMAPTISAASKAVPPSPRKKVLQEMNGVINSLSDSLEFPVKEAGVCVEIEEFGVKSEMGFGSKEVLGSGELKKGESRIKNHRNVIVPSVSPLPVISSLDADPSLPPYDPKTNYLSPRPQFLHYRPNPRTEHYLNREGEVLDVGDGRRLEDSFSSESDEDDATALTEEKDSESGEDDVTLLTQEKDSEVGEDDVTVLTKVKDKEEKSLPVEVEEVESLSETLASEPNFNSKALKCQPSRRSKLVPYLLVLVMACLYVPLTDSPIISSSMFKEQSLPKFYTLSYPLFEDLQLSAYFATAKGNLHGLAGRFKHWSTDSIAYFTSVTSLLRDDVSLYPLVNMTVPSAEDDGVGSELNCELETETEQAVKEDEIAEDSLIRYESEVSAALKDEDAKCNAETVEMGIMDENTEMEGTNNEAKNIEMVVSGVAEEGGIGAQRIGIGVCEDVVDADIMVYEVEKAIAEADGRNELEQEASPPNYEATHIDVQNAEVAHDLVVKPEIIEDEEAGGDVNSMEDTQSPSSVDNGSDFTEEYQILDGLELLKSINYATVLGLSSALVVLASTSAFLSMKQRQIPAVKKGRETIKKIGSVSGSSEIYIHGKRSPSQNPQGSEGMIGVSGLSEASSSWNNTSHEAMNLSHERRLRRDSASSSSISYGSFTTYEKLSAKMGGRDEEVVTPVRRSSRIRNLVTSP